MPSDLSFEDHARIKSRQHRGEKQIEQRSEDGPKNRDIVAKKMTSDQLAEAQRMAREMVEANPKLMGD